MRLDGDSIYACPWEYDSMFEVVEWAIEKVIAERKFNTNYYHILNHKKCMTDVNFHNWLVKHKMIQTNIFDLERIMAKVFDLDAIIEREEPSWLI